MRKYKLVKANAIRYRKEILCENKKEKVVNALTIYVGKDKILQVVLPLKGKAK